MKKYFSRIKYSSLVRLLNSYGFKKIQVEGPDEGAMYHANFLRGKEELAKDIVKGKRKPTAKSLPNSVSGDTLSALPQMPLFQQAPGVPTKILNMPLWNGNTPPFPFAQATAFPALPQVHQVNVHEQACSLPTQEEMEVPCQAFEDDLLACPPPTAISPQTSQQNKTARAATTR